MNNDFYQIYSSHDFVNINFKFGLNIYNFLFKLKKPMYTIRLNITFITFTIICSIQIVKFNQNLYLWLVK